MQQIYDAGIINSYLKGKQVRQQREALALREQQALAQQEIARQRIEQAWQIHEQKLKESERINSARINKYKADIKYQEVMGRAKTAQEAAAGRLTPNPETGEFEIAEPGNAARVAADAEALKQKTLIPIQAEAAGQKQEAINIANEPVVQQGQEFKKSEREATQAFTAGQNQLNRDARAKEGELDRKTRMGIAAANLQEKRLKRLDDKEAAGEYVNTHIEGITTGDITRQNLNQMPIKERGKIINHANVNNLKILTDKEQQKLYDAKNLERFIQISERLNSIMASGNVITNQMKGEITALTGELDGIKKAFAVGVAGDTSILSEKEVPRISRATVSTNPAGWTAANPFQNTTKINKEANQRRINDLYEIYHERVDSLLGPNVTKAQREAFKSKFGLLDKPKKKLPAHLVPVE